VKVVITGDTGLLGANLCCLWRGKYDLVGISRGKNGVAGVRHDSIDMTNFVALQSFIRKERPDVVVHTAAMVSVDGCEKNMRKATIINSNTPMVITELSEEIGAYLIHISTDAFYQGSDGELCDESHPPTPGSAYAKTKLDGEKYVSQYDSALSLRTNIYGFNFQSKTSLAEWILYSLMKDETLKMFTDVIYSPILVNDLADIIQSCIEHKLKGVYNAGGSGAISKYGFATRLKEKAEMRSGSVIESSVKDMNFAAWRSTNMAMDSSKLERTLSVKTPPIDAGISRFCELYNAGYPQKLKEVVSR
jgi:dTDP-4-dehydrorhamnose reductase